MKIVPALLAALALAACLAVDAKTLRWSSAGDLVTMDPHAQNEGFTNAFLDNIYETLVVRGKDLKVEPLLATSWSIVNPTTLRFKLRPNVKFSEGESFTADDVVFSIQRAMEDTSNFKPYLAGVKEAKKVDDLTVDIVTEGPAPVLVPQLTEVRMMSKSWCVKHNVTKPQDFKAKEETFASRNSNGTGEYLLKSREADVKDGRGAQSQVVGESPRATWTRSSIRRSNPTAREWPRFFPARSISCSIHRPRTSRA